MTYINGIAKEQPSSTLPLTDAYSTIDDIIEASSTLVKPPGRDMPGYEVTDITIEEEGQHLPQ